MFRVAQTMEPGSERLPRGVRDCRAHVSGRSGIEPERRPYGDRRGSPGIAHRYLAKTSDSAERTLAEAAIAMLENRLDEAEALLGKLSDDPSVASQVEENLRQIAAKREELAD